MARASTMDGQRDDPASASALDGPARRSLTRARRRAIALMLAGVAIVAPLVLLMYRNQRFEDTGTRVDGTVVATHTGVFDRVTVSYRVGGARYRSAVHVDNARKYCLIRDEDEVDYYCTAEPTVIVDASNPGHATVPGALNFSPLSSVVFVASLFLSFLLVPLFLAAFGVVSLVRARRRRRLLAGHSWELHRYRVRGSRVHEVSRDGRAWRSLRIGGTLHGQVKSLHDEERVEIAGDEQGRIVVRAPGSDQLLTGTLGPVDRTDVATIAQTAGVLTKRGGGRTIISEREFVLLGGLGRYDVFDLDGWPLGTMTSHTTIMRWRPRYELRDRRDLLVLAMRSRRSWTACDGNGAVVATLRRAFVRQFAFGLGPGAPGASRQLAVRAESTKQRFEERLTLNTGGRAPRSGVRWTLVGAEGNELAHVTAIGTHFVVEILADATDPSEAIVLLAQSLLIALATVRSQGGGP